MNEVLGMEGVEKELGSKGDTTMLNQFGTPDREAFLRVVADFVYGDPSEAALGPFASLDEVTTTFTFNG